MATEDILSKLTEELEKGITTEAQVVYLLVGIRKLIERDGIEEKYVALNFHCDWALHSQLDRAGAKAILKQFDAAHVLLREHIELHSLPPKLRTEIDDISKMKSFEKELSAFLSAYHLPSLTHHHSDEWPHFLYLYVRVVEDIPLVVNAPGTCQNISRLTVRCELARKPLKHDDGEDILFNVRWIIHDKAGQSGELFVIHSFET